jgi:hypothetical protein
MAGPPVVATFGCFSYALGHGNRIRLHFQNVTTAGHSSLGVACLGQRRADLTALFGHVQRTLPDQVQVVGCRGCTILRRIVAYFRHHTSRQRA